MRNTLARLNMPRHHQITIELLVYQRLFKQLGTKKHNIDNHQKVPFRKKTLGKKKVPKKNIPISCKKKDTHFKYFVYKKANELPKAPPSISWDLGTLRSNPQLHQSPESHKSVTGPTLWWWKVSAFATGDACTTCWSASRRQGDSQGTAHPSPPK